MAIPLLIWTGANFAESGRRQRFSGELNLEKKQEEAEGEENVALMMDEGDVSRTDSLTDGPEIEDSEDTSIVFMSIR